MKKILFTILLLMAIVPAGFTYAQVSTDQTGAQVSTDPTPPKTTVTQSGAKLQNPLRVNSITEVILLAVDIMIYVGVSFAILAIIFVGFKFIMAQGNSEKLKDAKMWFMWIIIGLAILISSKVIVEIVKNTLVKSGVVNQGFL